MEIGLKFILRGRVLHKGSMSRGTPRYPFQGPGLKKYQISCAYYAYYTIIAIGEFFYCEHLLAANLGSKTVGESQTPMHYAAKNNAAASLKAMLRLGAHINDRDYKKRTPLFVAAETGKRFLNISLLLKGQIPRLRSIESVYEITDTSYNRHKKEDCYKFFLHFVQLNI